jgi:signal transduction histidine kinase
MGIVEMHGGTFEVKSKEGQGSEFTITLPIQHKYIQGSKKTTYNIFEKLGLKK